MVVALASSSTLEQNSTTDEDDYEYRYFIAEPMTFPPLTMIYDSNIEAVIATR